ncbi:Tetratricopeptide repeat protein GNN [Tupaia chinensis]|uniref:Tetratricopeptide repeat protein GNN n=1 Tax=Tupaia chinensis TaxID=246437 RepID=L9L921_TUPCH|nr:Tetratricopeptide repeat protein GNN [Tupaia chinensis]
MSQKTDENVERCASFILKPQKPIQPYICSTLDDFQEERDFLANTVFPHLNELCNSRGSYFKAVDLSWSAVKVQKSLPANLLRQYSCLYSQHLKLCLDYVNKCFPFFICMLGQTYGDFLPAYSPAMFFRTNDLSSLSNVEQNLYVAAKNGYPWVLENPNCSLTEFEIMQAAFLKESAFQYFYFRIANTRLKTSDEEKKKLSLGSVMDDEGKWRIGKLKAKIISKGLPVRFYNDLNELGELVFKDWSVVIEKLYPATLMIENLDYKHSFERFYHEEFTEKCKQAFIISKESNKTFEILEKFALKDVQLEFNNAAVDSTLDSLLRIHPLPVYKSILLLTGERGCGKSTLIASWVNYFKKKYPSVLMIPHFVGSTCESSDIMSVIRYFITELQHTNHGTQLETDFLDEDSNVLIFSLLVEAFIASINLKPCILVLDGIEELIGIYGISGQKAKDFSWLPCSLAPHCKFIMSTVSSSLSYKSLCTRPDVRTVELSTGDEETKLNIFRQHFSIPNSDPFRQSRQALRKKPNLSPLKLTILANELKECRIYRNELQCMREYLDVVSIQELWELILKRWIEDYSWTLKQKRENADSVASREGLDGWVADALCLLCISHCGLAEDELLQLLEMLGYRNHHKVTPVHWAAFRNASQQWVQEKPNGLLYFRHQSLRRKQSIFISEPNKSQENPFSPSLDQILPAANHLLESVSGAAMAYENERLLGELVQLPLKPKGPRGDTQSPEGPATSRGWTEHIKHSKSRDSFLKCVKENDQKKKESKEKVLECRLSELTANDKYRLMIFIGSFLKLMGKTNEARELLLNVEDMLIQSQSHMVEMLPKVQNAIGELHLEIGMTKDGCQYFQKAWSNLLYFSLSDLKDNQDLLRQKVKALSNLAKSASEEYLKENHILDHATEISKLMDNLRDQATMKFTEGVLIFVAGNISLAKMKLQECLNIRRSLFGEKNMLVGEIMEFLADVLFFTVRDNENLLREIELIRGRRCWPQGMSQQSSEDSRNSSFLWEHLIKLDYHAAQGSNTVTSAMCLDADKLQRAKSMDLAPHTSSHKSKCASGKGKKTLRPNLCNPAEEKTQQKTHSNVERGNGPGKEMPKKKKDASFKILSLGNKNGSVNLSRQKILSAQSESGEDQITIYHYPLVGPPSTDDSWDSLSELISEKWLFHSPVYRSIPQRCVLQRRSLIEAKLLRTSNVTNKE